MLSFPKNLPLTLWNSTAVNIGYFLPPCMLTCNISCMLTTLRCLSKNFHSKLFFPHLEIVKNMNSICLYISLQAVYYPRLVGFILFCISLRDCLLYLDISPRPARQTNAGQYVTRGRRCTTAPLPPSQKNWCTKKTNTKYKIQNIKYKYK